MPTISLGWIGTVENNSGAGDVARSNVNNIKSQNGADLTDWTSAQLGTAQSTQRLRFTNLAYDLSIDASSTVVGVLAEVHGYTSVSHNAFVEKEFFLVNSGSTIGSDQATGGRPLGGGAGDPRAAILKYGGPAATLGASLTPAICNGATFGGQFRAENPSGSGVSSDEARLGVVTMAVYWSVAPACRLVPLTPTTVKAGNIIGVHARDSIVGTASPEHVVIRYRLLSKPAGYTPRTFTSPVTGLATTASQDGDGRGWCYLIRPTVAGTYTIQATMLLRDSGVWKKCFSNDISFTVEANNRDTRYLDPVNGNDLNNGESSGSAWATLAKAHTMLNGRRDWTLVIADDTTIQLNANGPNFLNVKNAHVVRSGTGTNKPVIQVNTSDQAWEWGNATDLVFVGIKVKGNFTDPNEQTNGFHSPDAIHRLALIDCEFEDVQSVLEGNDLMVVLLENVIATNFARYIVGIFGDDTPGPAPRGMLCVWGGSFTVHPDPEVVGEGAFRLNNVLTTRQHGVGASFNFVKFDMTDRNYGTVRHGWNYVFINRRLFLDGVLNASHPPDGSAANGPADWVCTVHGCLIITDTTIQGIDTGLVMFARQAHHVCFSHSISIPSTTSASTFKGASGQCYYTSIVNCMFRVPVRISEARLDTAALSDVDIIGFRLVGCCQVYEAALSGATFAKLFRNTKSYPWFDSGD